MKSYFYTLLLFCCVNTAWATTFTVSNLNDAGAGSLRQAITDANADGSATMGSPHIINVTTTGTINITSALPTINNHMTINGHTTGSTVNRNNAANYRIFTVNAFTVSLNNLIMTNGNPGTSNPGGAINNNGGTLSLDNCVMDGNNSGTSTGGHGGAINNQSGTLNVNNSTIKNSNSNLGQGGAINVGAGTATLTNCTIHNNEATNNGGAIFVVTGATLNTINCTIIENVSRFNSAGFVSGGIFYASGAMLNMTNTILANNLFDAGFPTNRDLNSFNVAYTGINNNNIVTNCNNGISPTYCSGVTFASTANPNLGSVSTCGIQDVFIPNMGSFAINNGTTTGALATDICGNAWSGGHDIGSVESTPPSPPVATALDLSSGSDFVQMNSNINPATTNFTVECWIRPNGTPAGEQDILIQQTSGSFFFMNSSNELRSTLGGGSILGGSLTPNTWQHIAATWDGTNLQFYINGTLSQSHTVSMVSTTGNFIIGQSNTGTRNGNFQIDELRVWNYARCQAEIAQTRNCELVGNETNLVQYYDFNQGLVASNNASTTSLLDRQTNTTVQNGTLNNFALTGTSSNWIDGSTNGVTGTCSAVTLAEINLVGNAISIANNSTPPNTSNGTDFGSVSVSAGTTMQTFTIDNSAGTAALTINSITAVGGNSGDFTIGALSPSSPIPAGGSATFTVTFDPSAIGLRTTTLTIANDDCDESNYTVALQGTGVNIADLAITEWLTDPTGVDAEEQWVEIHNYGGTAVDIQNWRIKDEDSDDDVITSSSFVIPAGGYVIVCNNKATFENLWFNGCTQANVIEVTGLTLDNTTDEIILEDNAGTVVWSVAYMDDETVARATHYTQAPTFTNRTWGSKASPGINRGGNDPATGTLGYEKNNSTADANVRTASNGDMGSPMNTTFAAEDIVRGDALDFDGMDDGVEIGNPAGLNITNTISIEAWVNTNTITGDKKIVTKFGDVAFDNAYSLQIVNGIPNFNLDLNTCPTCWEICAATTTLTPGEWYHIAGTYDGTNMKIYINGIEENSIARTGNIDVSASTFKVGYWASGDNWDGQLDEVRLWNTARTATEVRENMHLTVSSCETGLAAYYQMNDGTGASTLADRSNNGHNGTLMNMTPATDWVASSINLGNDAMGNSNAVTNTGVMTGVAAFAAANLSIDFTAHSAMEDVTVNYQAFTPNVTTGATGSNIIQNPMWTVNTSTSTATKTMNMTFTLPASTLTTTDPCEIKLYQRAMNADGAWVNLGSPVSATATTATFNGITTTGQFMIVEDNTIGGEIVRGDALDFDGIDDRVVVGNISSFNFERTDNISLEAWVQTTASGFNFIMSKQNTLGLNFSGYSLFTSDGSLDFQLVNNFPGNAIWVSTPDININDGNWHHVVATYSGTSDESGVMLYVDGIHIPHNVIENTLSATIQNTASFNIGDRTSTNLPFDGLIDEVRVWNSTRSANDIRENMHLTLDGCETNLVAYYQFNDGTGSATLEDKARNGHDGALTNMAPASDWITSTVNIGNDASGNSNSETQTNVATGTITFSSANLTMNLNSHSAVEDITVTYQAFAPNATTGASGTTIIQNPVWTINKSSATATLITHYNFIFPAATFTNTDPTKYALYWRPMNSEGTWTKVNTAQNVTSTTATFTNIDLVGQFMVVQTSENLVSDVRGSMYEFDGVDDCLSIPNTAATNFATGNEFTVEFWCKTNSTADEQYIINTRNPSVEQQYAFDLSFGDFRFFVRSPGGVFSILTMPRLTPAEGWVHIAGTYNGATGQMRLYKDGVLTATSNAAVATLNNVTEPVSIGSGDVVVSSNPYGGAIDELRFWNVARSQNQVRENMHLTLKGNETGLTAYYQFNNDDPVGTAGGVKDAAGSANNGVTVNMASSAYLDSEVAVAGGTSDRVTIPNSAGVINFPNTGVDIEFGATTPDGEIVVYRLETERPHGWQNLTGDVDNEYFVVRNFGNNTTFTALQDITFSRMSYVSPADVGVSQATSPLQLYKRNSNAFGNTWGTTLGGADNVTAGANGSIGYNSTNNITSFSQIVVLNTSNNSSLPVELLHFNAKRVDQETVALDWSTATETNNKGFEIQRMLEHETDFTTIGWLDGQGTTVQTTQYDLTDANAYSSISYYRLKQIDFDGSVNYSDIKAVDGATNAGNTGINIYPNPVSTTLSVRFDALSKGISQAQVTIVDIHGKQVYTRIFDIQSYQEISLPFVETLTTGVYLLDIELDNGEQMTQKFIRQ